MVAHAAQKGRLNAMDNFSSETRKVAESSTSSIPRRSNLDRRISRLGRGNTNQSYQIWRIAIALDIAPTKKRPWSGKLGLSGEKKKEKRTRPFFSVLGKSIAQSRRLCACIPSGSLRRRRLLLAKNSAVAYGALVCMHFALMRMWCFMGMVRDAISSQLASIFGR